MSQKYDENKLSFDNPEIFISPLTILLFLALLITFGMLLGSGATFLIGEYFGLSLKETMDSLTAESGIRKRNFIRFSLLANHLLLFVLPPIILSYTFFKKRWYKFLGWRKIKLEPFLINTIVGSVLLLTSLPLVQYLYIWNKKLPLPEWARSIESETTNLIQNLLVTDSPFELFFNIFVIAIVPAIGEEMVFRGIIQRRIEKWSNHSHFAIWISALLFSAFHMQLEGLFPRMLLGALLGYLFYWSKSLWIPIIVHFMNNGLQIIAMYFYSKNLSDVDINQVNSVPIWGAIISIILILSISKFLINFNQNTKKKVL